MVPLAAALLLLLALATPARTAGVRVAIAPGIPAVDTGRGAHARGFALLPPGSVPGEGTELLLARPRGPPVPSEVAVLARYPDGSARAVRLAALVAPALLAAGGALELRSGVAPPAPAVLRVRDEADFVEVDTGALQLRLARSGRDLLPRLAAASRELRDGARPVAVAVGVGFERASSEHESERAAGVRRCGNLEAVVAVSGLIAEPDGDVVATYELELTLAAGSPVVDVELEVRATTDAGIADDLALELPLRPFPGLRAEVIGGDGASFGLERCAVSVASSDGRHVEAFAGADRAPIASAGRTGLRLVRPGQPAVALVASRFRPNAPRRIDAEPSGLLRFALQAGPFLLDEGFAARADFALAAVAPAGWSRVAAALAAEPLPHLRGDAGATRALGVDVPLAPGALGPEADPLPRLLAALDAGCARVAGHLDYGDYRLGTGFANLEYDPARALLLAALAEGGGGAFGLARDQLDHWTLHDRSLGEAGTPEGFPWQHGDEHRSFVMEAGHVWAGGVVLGSMLLGEARYAAAARDLQSAVVAVAGDPGEFERERCYGWTLLALEDLLLLGPDPEVEAASAALAERLLARQQPRGWFAVDRHGGPPGAEWSVTPWVTAGITLEALESRRRRTGDPALARAIAAAAEFLLLDARREDGSFPKRVHFGAELPGGLARSGSATAVDRLLIAGGIGRAALLGSRPEWAPVFQEILAGAARDLGSARLSTNQAARALLGVRAAADSLATLNLQR